LNKLRAFNGLNWLSIG